MDRGPVPRSRTCALVRRVASAARPGPAACKADPRTGQSAEGRSRPSRVTDASVWNAFDPESKEDTTCNSAGAWVHSQVSQPQ